MQWICDPKNLLIIGVVIKLPLVRRPARPAFSGGFMFFKMSLFIILIYIDLILGNTMYDEKYEINLKGSMTLQKDELPL